MANLVALHLPDTRLTPAHLDRLLALADQKQLFLNGDTWTEWGEPRRDGDLSPNHVFLHLPAPTQDDQGVWPQVVQILRDSDTLSAVTTDVQDWSENQVEMADWEVQA